MNDRIKELRKYLGITQQEFADEMGMSRSAVANIETGNHGITNQLITAICRRFNVNEDWIRTGTGKMLKDITRDEQIAAFIGDIQMNDDDDDFKKQVIAGLASLDTEEWQMLERIAMKMMKMNLERSNNE